MPDPTPVAAIEAAAHEAEEGAAKGAVIGRRVGRVVGVFAAIFGGPQHESIDDSIDRYRDTRDAATIIGAVIGAASGAREGAERGSVFDEQFAELRTIEGLVVTRFYSDQIDVAMAAMPTAEQVASIARIFIGREDRIIELESAGNEALDLRDALIDAGVNPDLLRVQRNDSVQGIAMHVRVRT